MAGFKIIGSIHPRGFTLVELLVVLTIVGFLAGVVTVNAPTSRSAPQIAAERFAIVLQQAVDDTIINFADYRVEADENEIRVVVWRGGAWTAVNSLPSAAGRDSVNAILSFESNTRDNAAALRRSRTERGGVAIVPIDPLGSGSDLSVTFSDRRGSYTTSLDASGAVTVSRSG